jgi:hypothetical protein
LPALALWAAGQRVSTFALDWSKAREAKVTMAVATTISIKIEIAKAIDHYFYLIIK